MHPLHGISAWKGSDGQMQMASNSQSVNNLITNGMFANTGGYDHMVFHGMLTEIPLDHVQNVRPEDGNMHALNVILLTILPHELLSTNNAMSYSDDTVYCGLGSFMFGEDFWANTKAWH